MENFGKENDAPTSNRLVSIICQKNRVATSNRLVSIICQKSRSYV